MVTSVRQLINCNRRQSQGRRYLKQGYTQSRQYLDRGDAAQQELNEDYASETQREPQPGFDLVSFATLFPGCNPQEGRHVEDQYKRDKPEHLDADTYKGLHRASLTLELAWNGGLPVRYAF